jgi:hypothetical protein
MAAKDRLRLLNQIQGTWEAVFCSFQLCGFGINPSRRARIRRWVTLNTIHSGIGSTCAELKCFASWCRFLAVTDGSSDDVVRAVGTPPTNTSFPKALDGLLRSFKAIRNEERRYRCLIQMSAIARALPNGDKASALVALEKHYDRLNSAVPVNFSERDSIRAWSTSWAKKFGSVPTRVGTTTGGSATIEFTRKQGGKNSAIKQMIDDWFEQPASLYHEDPNDLLHQFPSFKDPDRFTRTGNENWANHNAARIASVARGEDVRSFPSLKRGSYEYVCDISEDPLRERERIGKIVRDQCLRDAAACLHGNLLPEAEVTVVSERGFKSRVVTKSPAWLVEIGYLVRNVVWNSLRRDPRVAHALTGGRLESFVEAFNENPPDFLLDDGYCVISADLTAATDGLAHWAIGGCWEGVCDGLELPQDIRELGMLVLGPMRISYPDLDRPDFLSLRGCLMGLPLSWFILNLINLWAVDSALPIDCPREERVCRTAVCGDDLETILPVSANAAYGQKMKLIGSGLSVGKHLISALGPTRRILIAMFTEQFALARPVPAQGGTSRTLWGVARGIRGTDLRLYRTITSFSMIPYIPVKSLVNPGFVGSAPHFGEMPTWATRGPAISSILEHPFISDEQRTAVAVLARQICPEWTKLAKSRILPEVPRVLGGGGFPPKRPNHGVADSYGLLPKVLTKIFADAKNDRGRQLEHYAELSTAFVKFVNRWKVCGTYRDVQEEARLLAEDTLTAYLERGVNPFEEFHPEQPKEDLLENLAAAWAPVVAVSSPFVQPSRFCTKFGMFVRGYHKAVSNLAVGTNWMRNRIRRPDTEVQEVVRQYIDGELLRVPARFTRSGFSF